MFYLYFFCFDTKDVAVVKIALSGQALTPEHSNNTTRWRVDSFLPNYFLMSGDCTENNNNNNKMKGQDPRQGRHSTRPAEAHLCWQAAGGWPHSFRLQHPERVHPPPCPPPQGWAVNCWTFFGYWTLKTENSKLIIIIQHVVFLDLIVRCNFIPLCISCNPI